MSKTRLTAESSNYYRENKCNTPSRRLQRFVSFIQDDESNQESDGSISNTFNDDPHAGVTPVNLSKRLSNTTPDRVLQLALEDKDKVVDQGRGRDNYPLNDKQTAKKNNAKALKSPKTKKNQTGKEPSLYYDSGDAKISEPRVMEEQTKPRITRRRGVKNTTENAGKTRGGRKLESEASKSIDEKVASRMLDKNAPDGANLKQKRGRPRKTPKVANLNVIDKEPVNDTPSRSDVISSTSHKATAFSEQDSDVFSNSESDDEDDIFSTRSSTLKMGTSKSSTQLEAFLTPVKNAEISSPETLSNKGSSSQDQPSNSSDSSASVHSTPRRSSFNFTTTPKGQQTFHKDRITSSHTEKNNMRLSPVLSPPTDKSSWVERTAAITNPVPMVSSPKSHMKLGSAGEKRTPKKTLSKVNPKKTIPQNISLSSYLKENSVQLSEETSALKRKSSTNLTSPLTPNKRPRRSLNESGKTSINSGMHRSDTEPKKRRPDQRIAKIANQLATENGDTANTTTDSVIHPGPGENLSRYNPYLAPFGDVLRARSLMSTEEYRVTWLYLEPKSVFTLKTFAPTTLIIVSGSIKIKMDETPLINLNKKLLTTEIDVGHRCIITNTGNTTAVFQTTENLEIS